jgi:glyoxylase-like metal-dependent hydrolase (beta-lactamase superfamily II)
MQIAPGVHHFPTGPFNWYLIEEGSRFTLVDAGFHSHYGVFAEGLRSLGRSVKDVEAIVLTHAHADHTGFAEKLRAETGIPVYVHQNDQQKAGKILQLPWVPLLSNGWRPFTSIMLTHAIVNGVFRMPSISKTTAFRDGDVLDVPGRPLALHVPGHTPGETAFFLPDRRVLFSGDALITRDLFTGKEGPPRLAPRLLNGDDAQARRSLYVLSSLGELTLLPGHGRPWTGGMAEAVALAIVKNK